MKKFYPFSYCLALLCFIIISSTAEAQKNRLTGVVYDYYNKKPLEAVTVQTSSGFNTISDSTGKFSINFNDKDSVWFSYLSKRTVKYLVDTINDISNFEIALHVDAAWLPAVKVRNSNYVFDSIQNRLEYAKVFNFKKPKIGITTSNPNTYVPGSVTAGIDLVEFINMFRFKRNRQILTMQERLIEEEQEKYIKHRYTPFLVKKLTGLKDNELDSFMNLIKPSYELIAYMNDLELGYYIEQSFKIYQQSKQRNNSLFIRKENEK